MSCSRISYQWNHVRNYEPLQHHVTLAITTSPIIPAYRKYPTLSVIILAFYWHESVTSSRVDINGISIPAATQRKAVRKGSLASGILCTSQNSFYVSGKLAEDHSSHLLSSWANSMAFSSADPHSCIEVRDVALAGSRRPANSASLCGHSAITL